MDRANFIAVLSNKGVRRTNYQKDGEFCSKADGRVFR